MNLAVEDLTCTRGGLPVIENLTFHVPAGTALILRGPNGSGKTTLLRTLAGLQPPASGTVLPGADAIAYAAHADAVKATLTVAENIAFWAGIHGHGDIGAAMSAFDLERLADRLAIHLSAGQRRRLGLARLAVTGRPVWALDEPTVSLDTASVDRFCGVVRDHLAAGGVAIIATHIDLGIKSKSLDIERFAALAPIDDFDAAFA